MPPLQLDLSAPVFTIDQLSVSGFELLPATVAALVLASLGASLVIASLRSRERDE